MIGTKGLRGSTPTAAVHYPRTTSPCLTCPTSPCCTYLPLHSFAVTTVAELDHAAYLLNFDRIELGLSEDGTWSVAYRAECRHLDPDDFSCRVHNTPDQPQICVTYNPHQCWYKRVLTADTSPDHIRLDRQRFELLVGELVFDDKGDVVSGPEWGTLIGLLAEPVVEAPVIASESSWHPVEMPRRRKPDDTLLTYTEVGDPCDGCEAPCCTKLIFPYPVPASRTSLDHLRFCLGFPGVEVGITDDAWSIIVDTSCRHLVG